MLLNSSFQLMETGHCGDPGARAVCHAVEGLKSALVPAPILQWPMVECHAQELVKDHANATIECVRVNYTTNIDEMRGLEIEIRPANV